LKVEESRIGGHGPNFKEVFHAGEREEIDIGPGRAQLEWRKSLVGAESGKLVFLGELVGLFGFEEFRQLRKLREPGRRSRF
jgi:hypothetical protein